MNQSPAGFSFQQAARNAMLREGFKPDFPAPVLAQVNALPASPPAPPGRDLRDLLWSSIDNADSRDLDQVEWAERLPNGGIRVRVGIADVDSVVKTGSPGGSARPGKRHLRLYRRAGFFHAAGKALHGFDLAAVKTRTGRRSSWSLCWTATVMSSGGGRLRRDPAQQGEVELRPGGTLAGEPNRRSLRRRGPGRPVRSTALAA